MFHRLCKVALPGAVLVSALLFTTVQSSATVAISKKENGAKCIVCHTAVGKKDLNDVGKCYKDKSSLTACQTK